MALQKQEVKMTVFGLMCDDCTETIEGCTSESTIRAYAASQGWRLVLRDGEEQDLCEDCYLLWQNELEAEQQAV